MTHRRRAARVYTKTVSSTISEETWDRLQAHAPWSAFIRDAIQEKLDGRIAELEQTMKECADELEKIEDHWFYINDINLDLSDVKEKLRGQSQ